MNELSIHPHAADRIVLDGNTSTRKLMLGVVLALDSGLLFVPLIDHKAKPGFGRWFSFSSVEYKGMLMAPQTRINDNFSCSPETFDTTSLTKANSMMVGLTTELMTKACRIFFSLAYPNGSAQIPEDKLILLELPPGQLLTEYHATSPLPRSLFRVLHDNNGNEAGAELRLGRPGFPHLKMKVQKVQHSPEVMWVFSVDTHDKFSDEHYLPPADHPDADAWHELQQTNAALKNQIEHAWEAAGLLTFNAVLKLDLYED